MGNYQYPDEGGRQREMEKKGKKKSIFTVIIQTVFIALFLCKRQYNLFLGCYLNFFPPISQSLPL